MLDEVTKAGRRTYAISSAQAGNKFPGAITLAAQYGSIAAHGLEKRPPAGSCQLVIAHHPGRVSFPFALDSQAGSGCHYKTVADNRRQYGFHLETHCS